MFGWQRKRAVGAVVDALRPTVGTIQHHGVPARFWSQPYVAGFFQFMIGHHAKMATRGRITGADLGLLLTEVFTELSNMNGAAIARRANELHAANDPEFNRGADDAAAVCFYQLRVLKNEANHPLVQVATHIASANKAKGENREYILSMMYMASLFKEVDKFRHDDSN
ncbi:hypothetical protein V1294_005453 [Bradyrhizobium sp. AZCC 1678]|uniref:hypothetical protein n=1 Tax=Bradyrhizobium sp. AZCC 1678 TaxID=3117030 RepID=UPI002FEF8F29